MDSSKQEHTEPKRRANGELLWSVVVRRPSWCVVRRVSCVVRQQLMFALYRPHLFYDFYEIQSECLF